MSEFFDFAERHGLALFPCAAGTKRPILPWKKESSPDRKQWVRWAVEGHNLAIDCARSGLIAIDLDASKVTREEAWRAYADLCLAWGLASAVPAMTQSARGGWHIPFKRPEGIAADDLRGGGTLVKVSDIRSLADGEKNGEVIGFKNRGYCVAPGSQFDGKKYILMPDASAPYECPAGLLELIRLPVIVATYTGESGASDKADVAKLVAELDMLGEFSVEPDWFKYMGAIKLALGDTAEGVEVALQMTHDDATDEAFWSRWKRLASVDNGGTKCRIGSMIHRYKELTGRNFQVRKSTEKMFGDVPQLAAASIVPVLPPLPYGAPAPTTDGRVSLMTRGEILPADCEDSLALSFASEHADDLRYCEEWGRWQRWDGNRWATDKTSAAYDLVRLHLRGHATKLAFQDARKVAKAATVAAVERMARTDRRIVTTADMWDADPWLLNTPGGVVDLRTGETQPADPGLHMTKITAVGPGGECPTWKAFLHKSLAADVELIDFVQRMLGYALTGDIREHALFFAYGPGGNGKGVLLNTASGIVGDYAKTAPVETFIDSPNERHPTDLAGLRGARLVTASETEKGRRWAEAKIKMLTGGDRISARFMRQDFFEFVPQFKLIIAGNHKPGLRSVDEAIRRRLHLIPFTVSIPEGERDPALPERLKGEWGGILAWMIEGCMAWQRHGLQPPAAVKAATDEYLSGEDVLSSWIAERCEEGADKWASRAELFASWASWATASREFVGTNKQFVEAMGKHGYTEGKREGNRGFRGVGLIPVKVPMPSMPH